MKNLFKTICDFIFSPCKNRNNQISRNSLFDSGSLNKFAGDKDEDTSDIRYNGIFKPVEPFNCELSIINKDTEEESFQESSLLRIINTNKSKEFSLDNLKVNFKSKNNLPELDNKNLKPVNRNLISEFNKVANGHNNQKALIDLQYNRIKLQRIGENYSQNRI